MRNSSTHLRVRRHRVSTSNGGLGTTVSNGAGWGHEDDFPRNNVSSHDEQQPRRRRQSSSFGPQIVQTRQSQFLHTSRGARNKSNKPGELTSVVSTLSVLAASVHFTAAAVVFAVLLMAIHANRRSTDILTLQLDRMDTVVAASGSGGGRLPVKNINSHGGHRGHGAGGGAGGLVPPPGQGWGGGAYAGSASGAMTRAPSPGEPPLEEEGSRTSTTRYWSSTRSFEPHELDPLVGRRAEGKKDIPVDADGSLRRSTRVGGYGGGGGAGAGAGAGVRDDSVISRGAAEGEGEVKDDFEARDPSNTVTTAGDMNLVKRTNDDDDEGHPRVVVFAAATSS